MSNINQLKENLGINCDLLVEAQLQTISEAEINDRASSIEFSGDLSEIIRDTASGKITVVEDSFHNLIGLHYNSGLDTLNDNIVERAFTRAYTCKPILQWVNFARNLIAADLVSDVALIENNHLVYLPKHLCVVNTNCEVEAKLATEDLTDPYTEEHVIELLKAKLTTSNTSTTTQCEDLPSEVKLDLYSSNKKDILRALRLKYQHCLARGCEPTIEVSDSTYVTIKNIVWGRKLSNVELEKLSN